MNLGVVVTEEFYDMVPGLAKPAAAKLIREQMRELREYMEARFVEFIPTLGSGATGNTDAVNFNPAIAEGKWVRNASFTFDAASDEAVPTAGSLINNTKLNGEFARLGPDQRPIDWDFQPGYATGDPKQWAVVEGDAPSGSRNGRSMRCVMKQISCTVKKVDGGCDSEQAFSPVLNIAGGSVLQITIWAKLTAYSWGGSVLGESLGKAKQSKGPQLTAVPKDAKGGSQLYASTFLNPHDATTYNISEWHQYTLVVTVSTDTVPCTRLPVLVCVQLSSLTLC